MSSKRDYVAVAAIIKTQADDYPNEGEAQDAIECIARGLASHFEQHSPAFDRVRFLTACGVPV